MLNEPWAFPQEIDFGDAKFGKSEACFFDISTPVLLDILPNHHSPWKYWSAPAVTPSDASQAKTEHQSNISLTWAQWAPLAAGKKAHSLDSSQKAPKLSGVHLFISARKFLTSGFKGQLFPPSVHTIVD